MSDPERGWMRRDVEVGGRIVPMDAEVWIHRRDDAWVEVEVKGRRGRVPADAVGDRPFERPSLAELRRLDSCFGLQDEAFEQTHIDRENYFEILRCRAHGRRFLRDVVGGIAWRSRVTLLSDEDEGDPVQIWRTYHDQSDAWHARRGRTR